MAAEKNSFPPWEWERDLSNLDPISHVFHTCCVLSVEAGP